jgi:hypothetical protein
MPEDRTSNSMFSQAAVIGMLSILLLQGFHTLEHTVQVFQRFVFFQPQGAGVLGTWVDVEPVHLGYNVAFMWLFAITYWEARFWTRRKTHPGAFYLLTFSVLFQSWHNIEHIVKMSQFVTSGNNGTPGILGDAFNLVWLHFIYNLVVFAPFVAAFFIEGYHKEVMKMGWFRAAGRWMRRAGPEVAGTGA